MHVGKKLAVVLSVLMTGIGAALFFRKDSTQAASRDGTVSNPFGQRVERRVLAGAAWARKIGGPLPAIEGRPPQPLRVPASATAAILEPNRAVAELPPTFQRTSSPVGALLEPIDGVPPGDDEPVAAASNGPTLPADYPTDDAPGTHRIVDGDTLTKISIRYLGRADRYLEIFELNRDVLSKPDLLPIGSTLRIPPREAQPPSRYPLPNSTRIEGEAPLPMVNIPHGKR